MKKSKRIAAWLIAGLLALTPCAAYSLTAYAGATDPYTITVDESVEEYAYNAYQIFSGTLKDGKLAQIEWASGFDSAAFLTALKGDDVFLSDPEDPTSNLFKDAESASDVADVLKTVSESDVEKLSEFAKLAKANIGTVTPTASSYNATSHKHEINVTGSGYYLVEETAVPPGDPAGTNEVYSRFMMQVVDDATVKPKRELPELEKWITGPNVRDVDSEDPAKGKANAVSIGDTVSFEIDSAMPDMTGYSKYYFVINDTLADGLTFDPASVVVKIADATLVKDTDYEVQTDTAASPYTFQIVFKDFLNRTEAKGTPITVTYDAVLNENADCTTAGNLNTANLTYSNNPNVDNSGTPGDEPGDGEPVGETPDKKTKTYTANILLTKTDGSTILTGAKFKIEGTSAKCVLINGTAYVKDASGTFYKLKDGTFTETPYADDEDAEKHYDGKDTYSKVTNVTKDTSYTDICMEAYVKADGTLEFGGLGAGTYTITELEAPEGYNKLAAPIVIEIKNDEATFDDPKWTATKDGEALSMTDTATASFEVINKEGSTLPSTGGIGTKLFYLIGGMLAVGSGVVLVTKKRMSRTEK